MMMIVKAVGEKMKKKRTTTTTIQQNYIFSLFPLESIEHMFMSWKEIKPIDIFNFYLFLFSIIIKTNTTQQRICSRQAGYFSLSKGWLWGDFYY